MKQHKVTSSTTGEFYRAEIQNICTCGWKGKKVGVYNNWYPTILSEEANKHISENDNDNV